MRDVSTDFAIPPEPFRLDQIFCWNMSPELDTLDQLQGGSLPLAVVCGLFDTPQRFIYAAERMLAEGDVRRLERDAKIVPSWRWREALSDWESIASNYRLEITKAGAKRVG